MDWGFSKLIEKADFNTLMATCVVVGWIMFFACPNNMKILAFAFFTTVYCAIRLCVYLYKSDQAKNYAEIEKAQFKRLREKEREEEFAKAKYVYDRLNNENQTLLKTICEIAQSSTLEGKYIIKNPYEYYQIIFNFKNLLNTDFTLAEWVDYDEYGDSFCFTIKSPLDKIIRNEV